MGISLLQQFLAQVSLMTKFQVDPVADEGTPVLCNPGVFALWGQRNLVQRTARPGQVPRLRHACQTPCAAVLILAHVTNGAEIPWEGGGRVVVVLGFISVAAAVAHEDDKPRPQR